MLPKRNDEKNFSRVTISLVAYNGETHLPYCLRSIAAQTFHDVVCVVYDNHSILNPRQIISQILPDAEIILGASNSGFAAAHNEVITLSDAVYVLVLNQDVVLAPNYIQRCVAFMDAHPLCGSVSGVLLRVDQLTKSPSSDIIDTYGMGITRSHAAFLHGEGKSFSAHIPSTREVFGVPATAALYRRRALAEIADYAHGRDEYFDERFFAFKEDVDIAYRLRMSGWQAWSLADARAYHVRTAKKSAKRSNTFVNNLSYRNHLFFLIKNVSAAMMMRVGLRIIGYEILKFFYLLLREPRVLRGWVEVAKAFPELVQQRKGILARQKLSAKEFTVFFS